MTTVNPSLGNQQPRPGLGHLGAQHFKWRFSLERKMYSKTMPNPCLGNSPIDQKPRMEHRVQVKTKTISRFRVKTKIKHQDT